MVQKRIEWIDVAKGLGIILVIIGHCAMLGGTLHNWIFSFHMPLFFILSGMFVYKEKIIVYVKKKFKTLIIPYIVFSVIGFGFTVLIPTWRDNLTWKGIAKDIYFANPDYINISSIWFLSCLFITSVLLQVILRLHIATSIMVIVLTYVAGIVFSGYGTRLPLILQGRLPVNIDVALVALLFMALGYYGKNLIHKMADRIVERPKSVCVIYAFFLFVISLGLSILNHRVNLHGLTFNNPILYLIESIVGSMFIIAISCLVCKFEWIKSWIIWLGKHSLVILGIQALAIRIYILLINEIEQKNYELYFLPQRHAIISSVFVTFVSITCAWIWSKKYNKR